ncbi:MAG: adenosylcobinamide-phosphate synthase CbiB [Pontibacterium sp.]
MSLIFSLLIALILDYWLKEPKRFHPLVGFGNWASFVEQKLNQSGTPDDATSLVVLGRSLGIAAWVITVIPIVLVAAMLSAFANGANGTVEAILGGVVLYLAIGWQSLISHAMAIATPLKTGDINSARQAVGMIVSRDTSALDEQAVASAATESVLENGADAIFAAIFWFCVLGIPGVVLYRLSNTLDAMWGYKNARFLHFGWCAARVDDVLNYLPARLTALSYAWVGKTKVAFQSWKQQAPAWKSPNAGPVMAAGAGAINVSLGGAAIYHGQIQERPPLGPMMGDSPSAKSIQDACHLVNRALVLWTSVVLLISLFVWCLA